MKKNGTALAITSPSRNNNNGKNNYLLGMLILVMVQPLLAQSITDYRWQHRIVLLVGTAENRAHIENTHSTFLQEAVAMRDRQILLLQMDRESVYGPEGEKLPFTPSSVRSATATDEDFEGVILIGKDGGVKSRWDFDVKPKQIWEQIDGMPMRRAEMKHKSEQQ